MLILQPEETLLSADRETTSDVSEKLEDMPPVHLLLLLPDLSQATEESEAMDARDS